MDREHGAIQVIGLGPGDISLLTLGALERLQAAGRIFLRTLVHPTVEGLRARLGPDRHLDSFDERYERAASFEALYEEIVEVLLAAAAAAEGPIAYAVPGHPLVGERSVRLLLERAPARGVAVEIVHGLSFLEPVASQVPMDPLAEGLQLIDGSALIAASEPGSPGQWSGSSVRLVAAGRPLLIGQVYDRRVASACKLWLLERYPPEHRVLVIAAVGAGAGRQRAVALAELDHSAAFDHLTSLYVPPLAPLDDLRGQGTLPFIAARLRAVDGCPWDRKQTWDTLKPHLLEEVHEAVAALDAGEAEAVVEELGDVLLLVTMLAQIGDEEGSVDLPSVLEAVNRKLIRRHPHVFGELRLDSVAAVVQSWERLKSAERAGDERPRSALDGVPLAMPALIAAQVMGRKAAALGFDWASADGVLEKVREELDELRAAPGEAERLEEMGDLLFTLVSVCRHLHLDAEEALRRANGKFRSRFVRMEEEAAAGGVSLGELDLAALETLWAAAKAAERA